MDAGPRPGLRASVEHVVTASDTASALGSGDVDVLATPFVIALCERAAVSAVRGHLSPDRTSVGVRISIEHLAPTAPGRRVVAHASLESVDGKTLEFAVEASDEAGVIARGLHTRVVVDRSEFLRRATGRRR